MLLMQDPKLLLTFDEPVAGMTDDETLMHRRTVRLPGRLSTVVMVVEHRLRPSSRSWAARVTVPTKGGSVLAEGAPWPKSRTTSGSSKSISALTTAEPPCRILHQAYGGSHILRGLQFRFETGARSPPCWGRTASARPTALKTPDGPGRHAFGDNQPRWPRHHCACPP